MITRGFRRRRDYEAEQEMEAREDHEDVEDQAENPERPVERQSPPEGEDRKEHGTLFSRIWNSLRGQ